jgi:Fe-S cluster assembly protein SufD
MGLMTAKSDALAARLQGRVAGQGGWLGTAQEAALDRLQPMGLPGKRDEYWRYTDPSSLTAPAALKAELFDTKGEARPFSAIDRLKIVFVDGVFDAAQSDAVALEGLEIAHLADAAADAGHWAAGLYGTLEARGRPRSSGPWRR